MIDVGKAIALARKAKGIKQYELARRAEISPAQLCQIETGRVSPLFSCVERIVAALDSDIPHLIYGEKGVALDHVGRCASRPVEVASSLVPIRVMEPDASRAVKALTSASEPGRVMSTCTLAFNKAHAQYEGAGVALAEELRAELGLGTAPVGDLAAALGFRGVRVVQARLSRQTGSVSLWDVSRDAPVIVLNAKVTPERRLFRLVYELGSVALYRSLGIRLDESLGQHRFLTDFTAAFLMPAVAVRTCAAACGVAPGDWTLKDVISLKSYFGVSAEAFALRLEELGLIVASLRLKIRDDLRAYYRKHPEAMEPHGKPKQGRPAGRLAILKAAKGGRE